MSGLDSVCEPGLDPEAYDDFTLGRLTPCFHDGLSLLVFNLVAMVCGLYMAYLMLRLGHALRRALSSGHTPLLAAQGLASPSAGAPRADEETSIGDVVLPAGSVVTNVKSFRLLQAVACVYALVPLLQLVGRLEGAWDSPFVRGSTDLMPFEILSLPLEIVAWLCVAGAFLVQGRIRERLASHTEGEVLRGRGAAVLFRLEEEDMGWARSANWVLRFVLIYAMSVHGVKFNFIRQLSLELDLDSSWQQSGYLYLYAVQLALTALLCAVAIFAWPAFRSFADLQGRDKQLERIEAMLRPSADADAETSSESFAATASVSSPTAAAAASLAAQSALARAAPGQPSDAQEFPSLRASLLSKLSFAWISPLLELGFKRPLIASDIWRVNERDSAATLQARWQRIWAGELAQAQPSVLRAIYRLVSGRMWFAGFLKLFNDAAQFVGPIFLGQIVDFIEDGEAPMWEGIVLAAGVFLGAYIGALAENQYFLTAMRVGTNVRSALVSALFQKSVLLSQKARSNPQFSTGNIMNLMTSDAAVLDMVCGYVWTVFSSPARILIASYLLYQELGVASFAGTFLIIILLVVQRKVVSVYRDLSRRTAIKADERVKLINECFAAVSIVKHYAWEQAMYDRIQAIRAQEIALMRSAVRLQAFNFFLTNASPVLVTIVSFGVFAAIPDNTLTARKGFTALSLFSVLRFPLSALPFIVTQLAMAKVALVRLQAFLGQDELRLRQFGRRPEMDPIAVSIRDGSFAWPSNVDRKADPEAAAGSSPSPSPSAGSGDGSPADKGQQGALDEAVEMAASAENVHLRATLRDINLEVPRGGLAMIVGQTASGKSSLLAAILGDIEWVGAPERPDPVYVGGPVAYVPQQSWIFSGTIRENVCFGLPYNPERFAWAVRLSCLAADLEQLAGGDLTEIGERGVTLSGGQKQRVSLCRALYAQADIILLDDPLSALDAHVGAAVFTNLRSDAQLESGNSTRVLVTNQLQFCPQADRIFVMHGGRIVEQGSYEELVRLPGGRFARMMAEYDSSHQDDPEGQPEQSGQPGQQEQARGQPDEQVESVVAAAAAAVPAAAVSLPQVVAADDEVKQAETARTRSESAGAQDAQSTAVVQHSGKKDAGQKDVVESTEAGASVKRFVRLIDQEDIERGLVRDTVLWAYGDWMGGRWIVVVVILLFLCMEGSNIGATVWLRNWSDHSERAEDDGSDQRITYYVGIYAVWALGQTLFIFLGQFTMMLRGLVASRVSHREMLKAVLRSPVRFFETTPLGRILNRFSKDQKDIDTELTSTMATLLRICVQLLGALVVISFSTPDTIATYVPLLCAFYIVQRYFQATSREVKRLDSVTRSPIFAHFSQCLHGMHSIRAYRAHERLAEDSNRRLDRSSAMALAQISINRWLSVRLELLGGLIVFLSALFLVLGRDVVSPATAGLSLSFALNITGLLNGAVRSVTSAENALNAVERVYAYHQLPPEEPRDPGQAPVALTDTRRDRRWSQASPDFAGVDASWPSRGEVRFERVEMRYRPGLPLVLKQVDLEIRAGEKVGIVGRTGSGKSSLLISLFRIVELESGRILIDGQDTRRVPLAVLRSRVSIIPQTPSLFTGSVRFNIDPFGTAKDDTELWQALRRSHLEEFVAAHPDGLDMQVGEAGGNLSVGQAQLVCLARALLRRSRILVLDEATASIDAQTDALVQLTIREQFADCTLITIAHRLGTIADSDRVLVMDGGRVREFDTPARLLRLPGGAFASMVQDLGPEASQGLRRRVFALEEAKAQQAQQPQQLEHVPVADSVVAAVVPEPAHAEPPAQPQQQQQQQQP